MHRFFDSFPRFYKTSLTGSDAEWNNRRYQVLIEGCRDVIAGQRIVDFGSHDGRWAFAALDAGARHVVCVEPEPALLEATEQNFREYKVDRGRYALVESGAMAFIEKGNLSADTAFLFGMLTVISEQPAFFGLLRRAGVRNLVIDTHIMAGEERPVFELFRAHVQRGNAIIPDKTHNDGWMMGLTPSLSALTAVLDHFGWKSQLLDWTRWQEHPDMQDYRIGRRISLIAR
jgi:hypothetical protein